MQKALAKAYRMLHRHPAIPLYLLAFLFPILGFTAASLLSLLIDKSGFALVFTELESEIFPLVRSLRSGDSLSDFFVLADPETAARAYLIALSPLNLPMIFAPLSALRAAAMLSFLFRIGLSGLTLALFLRRIGCKPLPSLALSVCYALSSYAVVGAASPELLDVLILFPIVALGILRIARGRGGALFGAALGLSLLLSPSLSGSLILFSILLYGYFRIVIPCPERRSLCSVGVFVVSLLLAILSALASIIPFLSYANISPSEFSFAQTLDFLDFCAKLLPGSFDGLSDAAFPYLSVGVLPLLLSAVFFSTKTVPMRLRIATGGLWLLLYLTLSISALNGVYLLFIPTLPLYGSAYFFVFLLTATGAYAWRYLSHTHERTLILSSGVIVFFAMLVQKLKPTYVALVEDELVEYGYISELAILWIPMLAVVLLSVALILVGRAASGGTRFGRSAVALLLVTVCLEGAVSCYALTKTARDHREQSYFSDASFSFAFSDSIRSALSESEENELYRVVSGGALTSDDGLLFGYHSLTSLNERILSSLGISLDENGCFKDADYPLALSLLGVRHYILRARIPIGADKNGNPLYDDAKPLPEHLRLYFENARLIGQDPENATTLYTSSLALPLLFVAKGDLTELSLADADSIPELLSAYFRGATGDATLSLYNTLTTRVSGTKASQSKDGYTVYSNITSLGIKAQTVSDAPLYFTLSTEYPRASTLSVTADGVAVATYPLYDSSLDEPSVTIPLGSFPLGTAIELSIRFKDSEDGCFYLPENASLLLGEDPSSIERAIGLLSERAASDLRISGETLSATIKTEGASFVQTTLPLDSAITVRVDGKRVQTVRALGEFLAIPISGDGEHRITLTLNDPVGPLPTALSAVGAVALLALAVLEALVCFGKLTLPYLSEKKEAGRTEVSLP
ncbi:MAG: YfhO family protein [Clostridia bacterium]|nr:YfhO family protein [Clostridia bacterium]